MTVLIGNQRSSQAEVAYLHGAVAVEEQVRGF